MIQIKSNAYIDTFRGMNYSSLKNKNRKIIYLFINRIIVIRYKKIHRFNTMRSQNSKVLMIMLFNKQSLSSRKKIIIEQLGTRKMNDIGSKTVLKYLEENTEYCCDLEHNL